MTIDVVIPYFDSPERLASILMALNAQVDPVDGRELEHLSVIVADDASTVEPVTSASRHPVHVVRLDEPGYHAAAARNRGAEAGDAPIVVFLDGDTVPSPTYVSTLVAPIVGGTAGLTTGHRRHALLDGLSPSEVAAFVADPDARRLLGEPGWLADGLRWTDSLRSGTPDVFQYVISAVLAVDRAVFDDVGGFDERFDSYGGEDWEFAYRCWNAGWDFLHVASAVAFHDGPDVEGRPADPVAKTIENLRIVDLVPASPTRLHGVRYSVPDIEIALTLRAGDLRTNAIGVTSILASSRSDLRLRLDGDDHDVSALMRLVADDRVIAGPQEPNRSARCHVTMSAPVELAPSGLARLCAGLTDGVVSRRRTEVDGVSVEARSVRAFARAGRDAHAAERCEHVAAADVGVSAIGDDDLATWSRRRRTQMS